MPTSIYDQWSQTNKASLAPLIEFNGITTQLCGDLFRENLKVANDLMQINAECVQHLSHTKGLEEVMSELARFPAKLAPQMVSHAQTVFDMLLDSGNKYREWFEKGVEHFQKQQEKSVTDMKSMASTFQKHATQTTHARTK